jgi:hypothetical protein
MISLHHHFPSNIIMNSTRKQIHNNQIMVTTMMLMKFGWRGNACVGGGLVNNNKLVFENKRKWNSTTTTIHNNQPKGELDSKLRTSDVRTLAGMGIYSK